MTQTTLEQLFAKQVCAATLANGLKEGYRLEAIIEDCFVTVGTKMAAVSSDEEKVEIAQAWVDARKADWLEHIVEIDDALVVNACTSLKARGELAQKYGVESVEAALRAKGVAMTEIKRPRESKQEQKKAPGPDAGDTSSNPWSKKFRVTGGPVKSEADRTARVNDARAKFIRMAGTAAAARMAKSAGVSLGGLPLRER